MIAHVQTTSVATVGPLAYVSNVKAGNLLIVFATWGSSGLTASVADSLGNSWTNLFQRADVSNTQSCSAWYAIAKSSGANTVTFTLPNPSFDEVGVAEYSGVNQASPLDTSNATAVGGVAATTTPQTGSVIPSVGGALIWSFLNRTSAQALTSPPTNFTQRASNTNNSVAEWIQSGNSTVNPQWTTASGRYNGMTAVFKTATPAMNNNYQFVKVGDGMSVSEKIR